jgi:hypothetical protein
MRAGQSVHLADGAIRHLIYMYRGLLAGAVPSGALVPEA